ncbi:hypothetical protein Clacol_003268 [Clathrus columnatus]|uniref:NAD(P)-binding domain-containing protein n=1 Tax=Clathrus columnatus TaxID=1419009 RepID=A0AAV5A2Z9_9AGAM|nr:hypothetical protein Clacol_003268 [Clathrus columnatus]
MTALKQTALILGATGATGGHLLKELLNSPNISKVGEFGRRITPLDNPGISNKDKLVQKVIDFEKPQEAGFTDEKWDIISLLVSMGTSKREAGSIENFRKIDQQSKGETEERLASLGYSEAIMFRPFFLLEANRPESRTLASISVYVFCLVVNINDMVMEKNSTIAKFLTPVSDSVGIPVYSLAKAMRIAGEVGVSGLPTDACAFEMGGSQGIPHYTVIPNRGALALSRA